jgi:hypothetical protein
MTDASLTRKSFHGPLAASISRYAQLLMRLCLDSAVVFNGKAVLG